MKLYVVFSYIWNNESKQYAIFMNGIYDNEEQANELKSKLESKLNVNVSDEPHDFVFIKESYSIHLNKEINDCDEDFNGDLFYWNGTQIN